MTAFILGFIIFAFIISKVGFFVLREKVGGDIAKNKEKLTSLDSDEKDYGYGYSRHSKKESIEEALKECSFYCKYNRCFRLYNRRAESCGYYHIWKSRNRLRDRNAFQNSLYPESREIG